MKKRPLEVYRGIFVMALLVLTAAFFHSPPSFSQTAASLTAQLANVWSFYTRHEPFQTAQTAASS